MKSPDWDRLTPICIAVLALYVALSIGVPAAGESPEPSISSQGTEVLPAVADSLDDPSLPLSMSASFYHIPGSVLTPVNGATTLVYDSMGCVHASAGATYLLNAPLEISTGSRIVLLRLYYDDTSSSDMNGWITRYDETGTTYEDLVGVTSVGSSGHGSNYGDLNHIVDTYPWRYVLNVRLNVATSALQICGLRVMYYDPEIFQDDFESGDTSAWSIIQP